MASTRQRIETELKKAEANVGVDGRDALVIYSKGGSNCTDRVTEIVSGKAEEALIAIGWRVKG